MSNQDDKGNLQKFPPAGLILSDAERMATEKAAEEERRRSAEDTYKVRQLTIAEHQTNANVRIARYTLISVIVAIVGNLATLGALWVAKQSSDAATDAAKAARDTLKLMEASGRDATHQTNQIIGNANWLARETMNAVRESRDASRLNAANAHAALAASIESSRADQRAWVGVHGIEVSLARNQAIQSTTTIRNYGRSPALRVVIKTIANIVWAPSREEAVKFTVGLIDTMPWKSIEMSLPQSAESKNVVISQTLKPNELADVIAEKAFLVVTGEIAYSDIFGNSRATEFCGFYAPEKSGGTLEACGTHSRMR